MIIYRYLSRQLFMTTVSVSTVLVLILVSGRFIKYMAEAAEGKFVGDILFAVMMYRLPGFLELILPLGLFLGILLSYGRLCVDHEMVVLNASGVGQSHITRMTLMPTLCMTLVVGFFSLVLSPWGAYHVESLFQAEKTRNQFETLTPGRFHSSDDGANVTYAQRLSSDGRRMEDIFMSSYQRGEQNEAGRLMVTTAQSGFRDVNPETGAQYLELHNGRRYEGVPGQANYRVVEFERYRVRLSLPAPTQTVREIKATSTLALWQRRDDESIAELQWRISVPLLVPIVALMAVPLSRVNPRQGRYIKLLPSILLYLTYLSMLLAARKSLEDAELPLWLGLWWVHLVFLMIALAMHLWPAWRSAWRARRQSEGQVNA